MAVGASPCSELASSDPLRLNPLIRDEKAIRWSEITPEHILPALQHQFIQFKERFAAILKADATPTFENTVLAIDFASAEMDRTLSVYSVLDGNHNTEALQKIQNEVNEIVSEQSNLIFTNPELAKRVDAVFQGLRPNTEEYEITKGFHEGFTERGIQLPKADQERLKTLYQRLSELGDLFDRNRMTQRNAIRVRIHDLTELKGIPEESIEKVRGTRDSNGHYWIAMNRPNLITHIMEKAESSSLRRKVFFASSGQDVARNYISEEEAGGAWSVDNLQRLDF